MINLCQCGCGRSIIPGSRFASGHQNRRPGISYDDLDPPNPSGLCQCGCGQNTKIAIKTRVDHDGTARALKGHPISYIYGHQNRGKTRVPHDNLEPPNSSDFCICGCGERTNVATDTKLYPDGTVMSIKGYPRRYVRGHHRRKSRENVESLNPSGMCMCGCGGEVKSGRRFINGHNRRVV